MIQDSTQAQRLALRVALIAGARRRLDMPVDAELVLGEAIRAEARVDERERSSRAQTA